LELGWGRKKAALPVKIRAPAENKKALGKHLRKIGSTRACLELQMGEPLPFEGNKLFVASSVNFF